MGKRRREVVRHCLERVLEGELRRGVIKLGGSLKGGVTIVIWSVTIARRRSTFK